MTEKDLSHDALARLIARTWRNTARFVVDQGRWYLRDDKTSRWREDRKLEHVSRCREFLAGVAVGAPALNDYLGRASTVNAVLWLARSDPGLAITSDQLQELLR